MSAPESGEVWVCVSPGLWKKGEWSVVNHPRVHPPRWIVLHKGRELGSSPTLGVAKLKIEEMVRHYAALYPEVTHANA